jgi:hypothetical protein
VQREVLAKARRALLVWGATHLLRRSPFGTNARPPATLITLLGSAAQSNIFNVWTHTEGRELHTLQQDVTWRVPSLALTKNSILGAAPYALFGAGTADGPRMEDQFDPCCISALCHASLRVRSQHRCVRMQRTCKCGLVEWRSATHPIYSVPANILRSADQLKQRCANAVQK